MANWPFSKVKLGPIRFAPVGECIYCGAAKYAENSTRSLGDEHIVPYGLGGRWVLPQASCRRCEQITGRFEQEALRQSLHSARYHWNLTGRRRKKPDVLPIFRIKDNRLVREDFPAAKYPPYLILLYPATMPGIMIEKKKGYVPEIGVEVVSLTENTPAAEITKFHAFGFDMHSYFRMIAKIAHSFAAAQWGIGKFKPTLLDIIINQDTDFFYYIGQAKSGLVPTVPDMLIALRSFRIQHYKKHFVIVEMAMCRQYDGPLYYIVAGEFTAPQVGV
jgi:hypothetical protein